MRRLPRGTEYERLIPSLRLEVPWATGTGSADARDRPPEDTAPPPSQVQPTVMATAGDPATLRAATADAVVRERRADPPGTEPVWAAIDRIALAAPTNVALSDGSHEVTYGRLRARTNRFAATLRAHGVQPGDVVPLALGRGIDMIEAMISVWKAGAAFLPMDPAAPATWLRRSAELVGARVYVTAGNAVTLPGATRLDVTAQDFDAGPEETDATAPNNTGIGYVIRTSGSSGTPKLVVVGHRGISNLLDAIRAEIPWLTSDATVLQFSSPYFDGVVFDVLMGLGTGARLAVFAGLADNPDVAEVVRDALVTHAVLPAAVVRLLDPADVPGLRVLLSVGDVCLTETARIWASRLRFVNGYGPTEATVCTTLHTVDPLDLPAATTVPIGRAVTGVHVVLTDDDLNPVPAGAIGEIRIGGLGVAHGYIGRPEESERRFPPDPYSPVQGARWYRTGDLGRCLPDGSIQFVGRRDDQVKVRGFLVEPAEVEQTLGELPDVAEAVVLFAPSVEGGTLVGYVRPVPGAVLDGGSVVAAAARILPAHLVPSAVVVLDQWPLTGNGKIDRTKLPRPGVVTSAGHVAPRTPVETIVAAIAARLLGLDRVGVNDVFFDLGGHSLLATQLVAQVKTLLGKDLELSSVMTGATIGEISATVEALTNVATTAPAPAPVGAHLVPSYMQQRVWLTHNIEPESVAYNAQGVLRLHGDLDLTALRASVSSYVSRHDVLRSRFPFRDGELQFELDEPWQVELPVVDLTGIPVEERDRRLGAAIRSHVRTRFELAEGRLIRWLLFRTAEDEHLLAHVEHHAVHDGWSFNVYLYELIQGYCDYLEHGEVRRPVPAIQFHDYAVWQREWLRSTDAERQRDFWRNELAGASTILPLPVRSRPLRRSFEGADPRFDIDGDLARGLDKFSRDNGVTLYMTMLAAYFVVLHRYSRSDDILVGSGFANRGFPGAEHMVGLFLNTVVIRGRLGGDPPFTELLARVRRTCLDAHDNQDLPFEEVLGDLDVQRIPGVNPLLQNMFTFHDVPQIEFDRVPLEVTSIEGMTNGTAKFDLNVIAVPRYATPGHISCNPGNVVSVPRSDGPVTPSPRKELDGVTLSWEYDSALFDQATMVGMLDAYVTVLETILREPDTVLSEFSLLSEENGQEVLALGVSTGAVPADGLPILIDRWIDRAPDRVAVEFDGTRLSYGELGARAGGVAGRLAASGVGTGDVVALNVPRSCDLVVAMVAVLKVGAAFVVLDPASTDPAAVFADSGARVTIVTPDTRFLVPPGIPVVSTVDDDAPERACFSAVAGREVACWHYSEGRGGTPRGVPVTHAEIVSALPVPEESVVLSGVAGDASVILSGLAQGAWLILARPHEVHALLAAHPVTHACLDFATFRELTHEAPDGWSTVRRVVLTGPVLEPAVLAGAFSRGVEEIIGTYGLLETGVFRTAHTSRPSDLLEAGRSLPIGRPLPHARLTVVDEHSRLAPFGMVGRLRVQGLTGHEHVTDDLVHWAIDGELARYGGPDAAVAVEPASLKPVEEVEAMVIQLVSEVLVVDDVTTKEDFFDLGGDSLLAMRLLARVAAVFGVSISLGEMMVDPTVEHLASRITDAGFTAAAKAIPRRPRAEVAPS